MVKMKDKPHADNATTESLDAIWTAICSKCDGSVSRKLLEQVFFYKQKFIDFDHRIDFLSLFFLCLMELVKRLEQKKPNRGIVVSEEHIWRAADRAKYQISRDVHRRTERLSEASASSRTFSAPTEDTESLLRLLKSELCDDELVILNAILEHQCTHKAAEALSMSQRSLQLKFKQVKSKIYEFLQLANNAPAKIP
jgi:hypothetical protein